MWAVFHTLNFAGSHFKLQFSKVLFFSQSTKAKFLQKQQTGK